MRETFVELGIIVRTVRAGEYDARLQIFTAKGLQWYTIKGVYRPKAKFAAAIGLFTVAEFTINGSAITGINILVTPYNLATDINRYYLANSIAHAISKLEFVEQTPQALILTIEALTNLTETDQSCYLIFIKYYTAILALLGYDLNFTFDAANLTHSAAKKMVHEITQAFITHVDYEIQFCEKMY